MKQDQSFDITPKATARSITPTRGRTWLALMAAATLVSAVPRPVPVHHRLPRQVRVEHRRQLQPPLRLRRH